mgnify:FL=1
MKKERFDGIESVNRNKSIEENLEIFEKILKGKGVDHFLRAKINMNAENKCMRDPVIYRINSTSHQRTIVKEGIAILTIKNYNDQGIVVIIFP